MDAFAKHLLDWFDVHGRHGLPWQHPRTPYRVWLSEVMLQQTQVVTVLPYFERFVQALPSLAALAAAPLDRVLALWSGLGYYSRARNLHRCAQLCVERHGGDLPDTFEALSDLPGIGRSTAGAILAQAHGLAFPILDGNVRRVLARYHGVQGWPGQSTVQTELWRLSGQHTPTMRVADYTQSVMDLGAMVCTRGKPACAACPLSTDCRALRDGLVASLPHTRPRKEIPTRATIMLVVCDRQGRVLLERRPPTGVWARLWSLPQGEDFDQARAGILDPQQLDRATICGLAGFVHTFSHFRLQVTPIRVEVDAREAGIADTPDRGWFTRGELPELGLPAPVRKLLDSLSPENPPCEPSIA